MSANYANFDVRWDDFMEIAEKNHVHTDDSVPGSSVIEISEQELMYEIKVDNSGVEGPDPSLFDEPMEDDSETVYLLNDSVLDMSTDVPFAVVNDGEVAEVANASAISPEKQNEQCLDPPPNENVSEQASTSRSTKPSQFVEMNDEDIHDFVNDQKNRSTLRKTIGDIDKFNRFLELKGESRKMKDIPPEELDTLSLVANFILSVRKSDGGEYEPSTIRGMLSSLDRKLRRHSYPESIINSKTAFSLTKDTIKAKLKALKKQGKGNRPKEAKPISDSEINIIHEKKLLGHDSPQSLLNTLWLNNSIHFGLRGVTEHYDLRWGDISLERTSDGMEYLELNERQSKTRTGENISDIRKVTPKMYQTDAEDDPVKYYKLYQKKRPQSYCNNDDPFYIAPRTIPLNNRDTDTWFLRQRVGIKKLGGIMKTMATKAGLDPNKRLTNHSARKYLVQKLRDNNIAPTDIMQITGHKNVQSVINYSSISDKRQIECSSILSNHNIPTSQPAASDSRSTLVNMFNDPPQHDQTALTNHELPYSNTLPVSHNVVGGPCALPSVENSRPGEQYTAVDVSGPSNPWASVSDLASYPTHSVSMPAAGPSIGSDNQISLNETRQFQSMFYGATLNFANMNVYCSPPI